MQKLSALCILLIAASLATAQSPGWQWVQRGGGSGFPGSSSSQPDPDQVYGSAIDNEGNLIVGGITTWTPTFDTVQYGNTANWDNPNFFLAKYDQCGNLLWVRVGGGDGLDGITGLDVDERGNIYTHGFLQSAGNPVYIHTPNKDTTITTNCSRAFMKFDRDGNLLYINANNYGPSYINNAFKRLRNGNFVTVYVGTSGPVNVGSFTMPPKSRCFIILDSLGNVIKGAMIDTIALTGSTLNRFVLDEDENIYFSIVNLNLPTVSFLSTVFNPAPQYTIYLFKTDTSFTVKDMNVSGYRNNAPGFLSYANGNLYCSGRNAEGAIYDNDTTHSVHSMGTFTSYKIDTGLNMVWVSRPDVQTSNPVYTLILPGASKSNLYLAFQTRGTLTWDSASFVTPGNTYNMATLRLNEANGICEEGSLAGGIGTAGDKFDFIETDQQGNAYFIGTFANRIGTTGANADTVFCLSGAASPDYFILKWGLGCNDTLNSLDLPDAPTNLVATGTGAQSIEVIWHNTAQYRLGFNLYRSPNGIGNWSLAGTTASDTYTFTDVNVQPATVYWYKVAAYTTGGESQFSNIDSALTFPSGCTNAIVLGSGITIHTTCGQSNGGAIPGPISGGTGSATILWSNGATGDSIANVPAGTYTVTITSGNCTATAQFVVNPSSVTPVTVTADDSGFCPGGIATICATAGFASYLWNTGGGGMCFSIAMAGNYYVTATDNNSCTVTSNHLTITAYDTASVTITYSGGVISATSAATYQWYLSGTAINGATSNTHTPLQSGSYTVQITDSNGCAATSNVVVVLGVDDFAGDNGVSIYPNPSHSSWQLTVGNNLIGGEIEVLDAEGRVVFKSYILHSTSLIAPAVSRGVYLLRISSTKSSVVRKLVRL